MIINALLSLSFSLVGIFLVFTFLLLLYKKTEPRLPKSSILFRSALIIRILSGLFALIIFKSFISQGDINTYSTGSQILVDIYKKDKREFFKVLNHSALEFHKSRKEWYKAKFEYITLDPKYPNTRFIHELYKSKTLIYFTGSDTLILLKLAAILKIVFLNNIILLSILYSIFSFIGSWLIFKVFQKLNPSNSKLLAYSILFLPSVCFWTTLPLVKEPLVLFSIGVILYSFFNIAINKNRLPQRIKHCVLLFLSCFLLGTLKIYILIVLLPSLFIWYILDKPKRIRLKKKRILLKGIFYSTALIILPIGITLLSNISPRYNMDQILTYLYQFQKYSIYMTERFGGSIYKLGEFDKTWFGLIKQIPDGLNVSLFRPYIWESDKLILIPAALESLILLIISAVVILKVGLRKFVRSIKTYPVLLFCFIFSLTMMFFLGFSTMNFGSLVRYKAPIIPFYLVLLSSVWYLNKKSKFISSTGTNTH